MAGIEVVIAALNYPCTVCGARMSYVSHETVPDEDHPSEVKHYVKLNCPKCGNNDEVVADSNAHARKR